MKLIKILSVFLFAVGANGLRADTGAAHQQAQARPVQLGTSGGNVNLFFSCFGSLYCSSGTLGSLVQDSDGFQYILSNNHVMSRDINDGQVGDDVSQPGLIDANCDIAGAVATFTTVVPINFAGKNAKNKVDAGIAEIVSGNVDQAGLILDVGQASSQILPADSNLLGRSVKKSGRTTGLTTGSVAAIGVTIKVCYDPCALFTCSKVGTFVEQIRVTPGTFSDGGDSGSLIVENTASCPRAVGLLFAGSDSDTFAATFQNVVCELKRVTGLDFSLVGCGDFNVVTCPTGGGGKGNGGKGNPHNAAGIAHASINAALRAKGRAEEALLKVAGVLGAGVGIDPKDRTKAVVEVYVEKATPATRAALPNAVDGVPVQIVETGIVRAY